MSEAEILSDLRHFDPKLMIHLLTYDYKISGKIVEESLKESRILKGDKEFVYVLCLVVSEDIGKILATSC